MIEGMKILVQTELTKKPEWAIVTLTILMVAIVILLILTIYSGNPIKFGIPLCLCIIASIAVMIVGECHKVPTGINEYQVTFDENVSIQEVYDKYEILEVNQNLWTIRDKEREEK